MLSICCATEVVKLKAAILALRLLKFGRTGALPFCIIKTVSITSNTRDRVRGARMTPTRLPPATADD